MRSHHRRPAHAAAILAAATLFASSPAPASEKPPATTPPPSPTAAPAARVAPGEAGAKAALDASPRHGEWVDVALPGSDVKLRTWVVYPERKGKAPVVLVIHEIFGLTDWIRSVADSLAADGFLAVAPDLISGMGPNGGGTESAASRDDVVKLIRGLTPAEATRRLDAVRTWALSLPAAATKTGTVGFCWGGSRSFAYAADQRGLNAAVVYYGTSPETADLTRVGAPVLGLYGADDARVTATVEPAQVELKKLGKSFEAELFEGAGHGFLRAQADREGANRRAAEKAWPRTIAFLKKHLETR